MSTYTTARRLMIGGFTLSIALLISMWSWASWAESASLTANPTTPRQNDTVTLAGQGFMPGETIAIWITYPDYRVYGVAEFVANAEGGFNYPYLPDFLGATFTPTGRYVYTAHGKQSGREVYAEIMVDVAPAPGPSVHVRLDVAAQATRFAFTGSGYLVGETVALWMRYPDNSIVDLGQIKTDANGKLAYTFEAAGKPVGRYALTARGLQSLGNGIAEFDVTTIDLTVANGEATLKINPGPASQRSYAVFIGTGFIPNEIVTIWVTLPDYSTRWIGDVTTDANGFFNASLYLSEQEPVGQRSYTAYGNTSGLRAVATYTLQPGTGQ
ncbi:hypothetical protein OSCT_1542 [Oscillochloris trichoides DG-6]|uniref:Uncharacterized protein n=1 Tax=Oscillochloris trichoides DG-6 TaxID=765420 RepID=E1IDZ1_9CHLR|nr:hypothetical protein [Oscillochloris trichoides]EFO80602.1 hypothetical protein OSCT_1542 [Oscillochloris trichoides DG-6]